MAALIVSIIFFVIGIIAMIVGNCFFERLVGKATLYFGLLLALGAVVGINVSWPDNSIPPGYYQMVNVKEASEKYTEEVDVMAICVFESNQDIIQIAEGDTNKSIVKIGSEMFLVSNETLDTLISNQYLIPYIME